MIRLTKQELVDITNEACELLWNAPKNEHTVLTFEESGNSLRPRLLQGNEANGKSDLFPRNEDPSMHILAHLASIYADDKAI